MTFFNEETYTFLTSLITTKTCLELAWGLFLFSSCWFIGNQVKKNLLRFHPHNPHFKLFLTLAANVAKTMWVVIGVLVFLGAVGINIGVLLKSIAVFGVGLGFVFKDLMSDVAAGFFIVSYKGLSVGTELTVTGEKATYTGKIVEMNLRYLTLENENQTIVVPNSLVFKQPLCISKK